MTDCLNFNKTVDNIPCLLPCGRDYVFCERESPGYLLKYCKIDQLFYDNGCIGPNRGPIVLYTVFVNGEENQLVSLAQKFVKNLHLSEDLSENFTPHDIEACSFTKNNKSLKLSDDVNWIVSQTNEFMFPEILILTPDYHEAYMIFTEA